MPVRLKNLYGGPSRGTLRVDLPSYWLRTSKCAFRSSRRETKTLSIPVAVPKTAPFASSMHRLTVMFDRKLIPQVIKPFAVADRA